MIGWFSGDCLEGGLDGGAPGCVDSKCVGEGGCFVGGEEGHCQ